MSTPRRCDVVVVGAGPGGSAAAAQLARRGRSVLVLERARFPRDKTCGDGLTTAALRELEALGFDPATVPSWREAHEVHLHTPTGRSTTYRLPAGCGTYSAIARREELDAALAALATGAGAEVLEGVHVADVRQDTHAIVVSARDGSSYEAPWMIGADGAWSPTRRALGRAQAGYRGEWHALRQYVVDVAPAAAEAIHVWFEPDILPAFVWSFPLADGSVNVGFGVRRDSGWPMGSLGRLWRELLGRPSIRRVLGPDAHGVGVPRAWPIPARVHRSVVADRRALWVGDAAAATDPLSGEGIAQALTTARLAAEAVGTAGPRGGGAVSPTAVAAGYERSVHASLDLDHRLADWLSRRVLGRSTTARTGLAAAGCTDWTRRNFARWLFEDYPRALLATPRRWSDHPMHADGAYVQIPPGDHEHEVPTPG